MRVWGSLRHTGQQIKGNSGQELAQLKKFSPGVPRGRTMFRDMYINVSADDHKSIEVLASRFSLHHGAQIAVDITLECVLRSWGNG